MSANLTAARRVGRKPKLGPLPGESSPSLSFQQDQLKQKALSHKSVTDRLLDMGALQRINEPFHVAAKRCELLEELGRLYHQAKLHSKGVTSYQQRAATGTISDGQSAFHHALEARRELRALLTGLQPNQRRVIETLCSHNNLPSAKVMRPLVDILDFVKKNKTKTLTVAHG